MSFQMGFNNNFPLLYIFWWGLIFLIFYNPGLFFGSNFFISLILTPKTCLIYLNFNGSSFQIHFMSKMLKCKTWDFIHVIFSNIAGVDRFWLKNCRYSLGSNFFISLILTPWTCLICLDFTADVENSFRHKSQMNLTPLWIFWVWVRRCSYDVNATSVHSLQLKIFSPVCSLLKCSWYFTL